MIKRASGLFEGMRGHGEAILRGGHAEAGRWSGTLKVSRCLVRQMDREIPPRRPSVLGCCLHKL